MDLGSALLKEHSKKQRDAIVSYIGDDPVKFGALIKLFFKGEYRITQRAAWPMSSCVQKHPELIVPYFAPLIRNLEKEGLHDAVVRNTLRLLQDVEIPKRHHGKLMSICFDYIQSPETAVAIKAFAITILHHLSSHYPDILPELKLIAADRMDNETAAFRQRAKKFL